MTWLSRVLPAVLSALLTACGAVGNPALEDPVPGYEPLGLVDVLGPDAIPPIDRPETETQAAAAGWLGPDDPVLVVEAGGEARAYPLAILVRHEVVNDRLGRRALAITYCPLTGAAVVFDREVGGAERSFGVSGKLYQSGLVLYDRPSRSLWPQMLGAAVEGPLAGVRLDVVPAQVATFADLRAALPEARVLARPTEQDYGITPYVGYDSRTSPRATFFRGEVDRTLPAMARVAGVRVGRVARAYPLEALTRPHDPGVLHDTVAGTSLVLFATGTARSVLDTAAVREGRRVGSAGAFRPEVAGRALRFEARNGAIVDTETGSTWSPLGVAVDGELRGARLERIPVVEAFWFAWCDALVEPNGVAGGPTDSSAPVCSLRRDTM